MVSSWIHQYTKTHIPKVKEAAIYGILLYSDRNPHIKKLVGDSDYWDAMNEISSEHWAIFSIKAKAGTKNAPRPRPGTFSYMVPVWKEPKDNIELLSVFGLESSEDFPLLAVFFIDSNEEVICRLIHIDDSTIENAFNTLKNIVGTIAKAISGIEAENLKNSEGVYSAVMFALDSKVEWDRLKSSTKLLPFFRWLS